MGKLRFPKEAKPAPCEWSERSVHIIRLSPEATRRKDQLAQNAGQVPRRHAACGLGADRLTFLLL